MIAALPPEIQSLFDAAGQLPGLLHQHARRAAPAASGTTIRSAALQTVELFGSCAQAFGQLLNERVFGTHLVHEDSDLLSSGLLGLSQGG